MVNEVKKWLSEVEHPAKGDKNLVELNMIENIEIGEGQVIVTLAFAKAVKRLQSSEPLLLVLLSR